MKVKNSPLITGIEDQKRLNEYIEIFLGEARDVINNGIVLGENTRGKMFDVYFDNGNVPQLFNHNLGFIPRGAFLVKGEPDPPYAMKYALAGTQVISNTSITVVQFDTLVYDDREDVTTGSGFKYEPNAPGHYQVDAQLYFAPTTGTGLFQIYIYVDGFAYSSNFEYKTSASNQAQSVSISDIVYLPTPESRIQILVYQDTGSNKTLGGSSIFSWMTVHSVGKPDNMVIESNDEKINTIELTSNVSGQAKIFIF